MIKTALFAFAFGMVLAACGINVIDSPDRFFAILTIAVLWVIFGQPT